MNNDSINTLQNILEALMTISVKGNDAITMSNCLQILDNIIKVIRTSSQKSEEENIVSEE